MIMATSVLLSDNDRGGGTATTPVEETGLLYGPWKIRPVQAPKTTCWLQLQRLQGLIKEAAIHLAPPERRLESVT
jgi:hypothetical protein